MDMPYPASRGPSAQSSAASRAPAGHADKARQERPEAADQKLPPNNRHTGNTGAHDVLQHNLWLDEKVDALMQQVKETQAKLEPKLRDRNEIADLLQRLDCLERRSAVAGRRVASEGRGPSNSCSDPAVSERRLGNSPFSLPTIREAAESKMRAVVPQHNQLRQQYAAQQRPQQHQLQQYYAYQNYAAHASPQQHQLQQYYAHPPAQRPPQGFAGGSRYRHNLQCRRTMLP